MAKKVEPKYVLLLRPDSTISVHGPNGAVLEGNQKPGPALLIDLAQLSSLQYISDPNLKEADLLRAIHTDPASILPQSLSNSVGAGLGGLDELGKSSATISVISRPQLAELAGGAEQKGFRFLGLEHGLITASRLLRGPEPTLLFQTGPYPRKNNMMVIWDSYLIHLDEPTAPTEKGQFEEIEKLYKTGKTMLENLGATTEPRIRLLGHSPFNDDLNDNLKRGGIDADIITEEMLAQAGFGATQSLIEYVPEDPRKSKRATAPAWMPLAVGIALGLIPYVAVSGINAGIQRQTTEYQEKLDALAPQLSEYDQLTRNIAQINAVQLAAQAISDNRVDWNTQYSALLSNLPQRGGNFTVLFSSLNADAGLSPVTLTDKDGFPTAAPPPPPKPNYAVTATTTQRGEAARLLEALEENYQMDLRSMRQEQGRWVLDIGLTETDKQSKAQTAVTRVPETTPTVTTTPTSSNAPATPNEQPSTGQFVPVDSEATP